MKTNFPHLTGRLAFALLGIFVLSACSAEASARQAVVPAAVTVTQEFPGGAAPRAAQPEADLAETGWVLIVPRLDEQGAVSVEITPLNLNAPGHTLDFSVALNTHSVDLSMDLAALATLATDTGKTVQAVSWDAPRGGHHVMGTLSFPSSLDSVPLLDGVSAITITLVNVDAPQRVFIWER